MIAKVGKTYYHYKNRKPYRVIGACKIQENDAWIDAVLYEDVTEVSQGVRQEYVRSELEFLTKFLEELP
jgi:hypothetical protein